MGPAELVAKFKAKTISGSGSASRLAAAGDE